MNENKIYKENILRLVNRNDLTITGVEKVVSFSPNQIVLIAGILTLYVIVYIG